MNTPKAFISYSWDTDAHKQWVAKLATDLRRDGVEAILDQWAAVPGDQLTAFMEKEIRENDYVLIICTPNYCLKSDTRKGGVGYEGDIMTAEVLSEGNHSKFIPILAQGTWNESAPTWLKGKYYVDLCSDDNYTANYSVLTDTLLGIRPLAPPVQKPSRSINKEQVMHSPPDEPLRIVGVIDDEVTEPKLDGTPGSSLYDIPLGLNRIPSPLWSDLFVEIWDHPPSYTSMHRPGIVSVEGSKIILNGTTIDELKKYHRETLVLCVEEANKKEKEILDREHRKQEIRSQEMEAHQKNVKEQSEDISFDNS